MKLEILAYETTPLGTLCLRRRELVSRPGTIVTEVTLNHEFLMSSYLTESERQLASKGIQRVCQQQASKDGLRVLVGGLGLGYTAAEVLASPLVGSVEVVEFLPEVIGWLNDGLIPLADQLNQDPRLQISLGDIYAKTTAEPGDLYDLIVIDVDHSPQDVLGEQSHGFYTETGLQKVKRHLKPAGVLGLWSYADDSPLLVNLKQVFHDVEVAEVTVWNDLIDVEQTDWLFFGRRE